MKASDSQVAGDHYKKLKPEPWEVMDGWNREHFIGFLRYSALKRLGRWDSKDGALQDVRKAIHELTRLEELLVEEEQAAGEYFKASQELERARKATLPTEPEVEDTQGGGKLYGTIDARTMQELERARKATLPTEPEEIAISPRGFVVDKEVKAKTLRFAPRHNKLMPGNPYT